MQNAAADMAGSPQGKKFTQLLILYTFLKVWKIEKKNPQNTIDFDIKI